MHLLKFIAQPDHATDSWAATISRERGNIELLLDDNLGMKPNRAERFAKAYSVARRDAAVETGLPLTRFAEKPPFSINEAESPTFWPAEAKPFLTM